MLDTVKKLLADVTHDSVQQVIKESESQEYHACCFQLQGKKIYYRQAKVTPIKIGAFVTFWKREQNGPIQPYTATDNFDFLVVAVQQNNHAGFFIFSKKILIEKKYISLHGHGGKLGFRVYPSWVIAENRQAQQSQQWQVRYFVDMNQDQLIVSQKIQEQIKALF